MDTAVRDLLNRWESDDRATRDEAALQAAMFLEKHPPSHGGGRAWEFLLNPELSAVSLDRPQLEELIGELGRRLTPEKTTPSMLWALGKAASPLALECLLKWLRDESGRDEAALRQALIGVDNFLSLEHDDQLRLGVGSLVCQYGLSALLERVSAESPRTAELAQRILGKTLVHQSGEGSPPA